MKNKALIPMFVLSVFLLVGCGLSTLGPLIQKTYAVVDSAAQILQNIEAISDTCPQMTPYVAKVKEVENALVRVRAVLEKAAKFSKVEIPTGALANTNSLETLVFELEEEAAKTLID